MRFGRKLNVRGQWRFEELTTEEIEKALDELREANIKEMKKCADEVAKTDVKEEDKIALTTALIERQCLSSYTHLGVILEKKASQMSSKPPTERPAFKEAEKKVEKEFGGKQEVVLGKSEIEKKMNIIGS